MVKRIAGRLVTELVTKEIITAEQEDEYEYALVCQIESVITIGSIILISILTNNLLPTICFLVSFLSLRKRTGGYHLKSFEGCYIGTMCIYGCVVWLCNTTSNYFTCIKVIALVASIYIAVVGTINHPNMDMDDNELRGSKKSARLVLLIEIFVITFLEWINLNSNIISYSMLGIIVCAALLLVAKILKQEVR